MNESGARSHRRPGVWLILFLFAILSISILRLSGAINATTGFILLAITMALMIPLFRTLSQNRGCIGSGASGRYTRRVGISAVLYVLGLGIAITLDNRLDLARAEAFMIALLPVLPIFGMIWAMVRYVTEESDEYLRQRAVIAALVGLAALLGVASFWGFLEQFGLVPHAYAWWAIPVWAVGMGFAQMWQRLGDRVRNAE